MTNLLLLGGPDFLFPEGDIGLRCLIVLDTLRLNVRDVDGDGMVSASSSSSSVVVAPPRDVLLNGNGLLRGCLEPEPKRFLRVLGVSGECEPSGGERERWSLSMLNMGLTGVIGCLVLFGVLVLELELEILGS